MRKPHFRALDINAKYRVKRVQLYELMHGKPMWTEHPTVMQFDTQNICNAKCIYCNPHNCFVKEHGQLSIESIEKVLSYAKNKKWFINYVADFMNGDPLLELRLPLINQMVKKITNARVILFTNGIAYNNRHLLLDKNVDLVNFTISAATAETYKKVYRVDKFSEALKTLFWFNQHKSIKQRIRIYYILCKENMHELDSWRSLFKNFEQNIRPCFASEDKPASTTASGSFNLSNFLKKANVEYEPTNPRRPCPCWDSLNISYKGEIMQCMDMPYEYNWGHVDEVDIEEVWHKRNKLGLNHEACKNCQMKNPTWRNLWEAWRL